MKWVHDWKVCFRAHVYMNDCDIIFVDCENQGRRNLP